MMQLAIQLKDSFWILAIELTAHVFGFFELDAVMHRKAVLPAQRWRQSPRRSRPRRRY